MPRRRIHLNAAAFLSLIAGRPSQAPSGGWTAKSFATDGERLILAIHRAGVIIQRKAIRSISSTLQAQFNKQLKELIRVAEEKAARIGIAKAVRTKAEITLSFEQAELVWAEALREVFEQRGLDVAINVQPAIQSVIAQSYSKVSLLMGQEGTEFGAAAIAKESRDVAEQLTAVDSLTRERIARVIHQSSAAGDTLAETAAELITRIPKLHASRAMTIARTETNKMWNKGTVTALKENGGVTHISVIGCESREEDRWGQASYQRFMYRGESTCNIKDVPIVDSDKLNFHPNHTGNIVPSKFATV